jgi:LmbE family N-acetylglucosaminyl deacetylase
VTDGNVVVQAIEQGRGRIVLVVVPHADDAAIRCGGTIALWARMGWRVIVLRVTDDSTDSVGLDRTETIRRNRHEFESACQVMGVDEILELGYETDRLADVPETELRAHFIRAIRQVRPFATASFDPMGGPGENNQDHLSVARAVDEAFWTSMFDKHHPEHLDAGLTPHGVFEQWYFARQLPRPDTVIDIGPVLDRKTRAVMAHRTMVTNMVHQARLQAATGGLDVPLLRLPPDQAPSEYARRLVVGRAEAVGARHGLHAAEEFRVVRFGGLGPMLMT